MNESADLAKQTSRCQWSGGGLGTDTALVFWDRATVSSYHIQRKSYIYESVCEARVLVHDCCGACWLSV
jgi:hypothetical protein